MPSRPPEVDPSRRSSLTVGPLLVILAPILASLVVAALLALAAWHEALRIELLVAAGAAAGVAGTFAMVLLYRQTRQRQAAQGDLFNIGIRVTGIVESAMDPIITVDDEQRIVMFNAAAERVFRWPRGAVMGQPVEMLLPERFRVGHHAHIERFGHIGVTSRRMGDHTVLAGLRADGEEFPIEASISHHREDGKTLYTVILRDIGERVRTQSLLARSEARLRGILDSAMDAIITVDESQRVVLFNAAAEAMFGCSHSEALGAPLAWFIPERFRATHGEHIRRFGESYAGSRRMGELRIVTGVRRNGEEFPIDASIAQLTEEGAKFYTVILRDVTARVRADEALRRSKEELQELGSAATIAREQEKSRISRELHDELGQSLTMLQMDVAWCKENLPPAEEAFSGKLDRMESLLKSTVAATRRIAADLRPLMLDDLGLVPAVEWLVQNFKQRTGITCKLTIETGDLQLPGIHSTAVFRIVQESLTNIAKHAEASSAEVTIERNGAEVTVRVRDDGRGFATEDSRKPNSFGLMGLRERAALLSGDATIISAPGQGTHIVVRLPVIDGADAS